MRAASMTSMMVSITRAPPASLPSPRPATCLSPFCTRWGARFLSLRNHRLNQFEAVQAACSVRHRCCAHVGLPGTSCRTPASALHCLSILDHLQMLPHMLLEMLILLCLACGGPLFISVPSSLI